MTDKFERLIERAEALIQRIESVLPQPLAAPAHVDAEILSALRGMSVGGIVAAEAVDIALEAWSRTAVVRLATPPLMRRAWGLRHNLSAYDALYVAAAESLGVPLVTHDARIAKAPGIGCVVEVLPGAAG